MNSLKLKSRIPAILLEAPPAAIWKEYVEVLVADADGAVLEYLAAKVLGLDVRFSEDYSFPIVATYSWSVTTNDTIAGPLIDRFGIATTPVAGKAERMWQACLPFANSDPLKPMYGPTRLVAAIRALVADRLGEKVWIQRTA